jgi:hypothetical protein
MIRSFPFPDEGSGGGGTLSGADGSDFSTSERISSGSDFLGIIIPPCIPEDDGAPAGGVDDGGGVTGDSRGRFSGGLSNIGLVMMTFRIFRSVIGFAC